MTLEKFKKQIYEDWETASSWEDADWCPDQYYLGKSNAYEDVLDMLKELEITEGDVNK